MPPARGAANAEICSRDSPARSVAPTTCCWALRSTRRSMPGSAGSRREPRSMRASPSSGASAASHGPEVASSLPLAVLRLGRYPALAQAAVDPVAPPSQRHVRSAPREVPCRCPVDPCPPAPRSLPGSSSTGTKRARTTGCTTSWAIAVAPAQGERGRRVQVDQVDLDLAAVARVDGARRVHQAEPEPVRQAGARMHEPGVAVGDRDRDPGPDERPLERSQLDVLGHGQVGTGVTGQRVPGSGPLG